MSKFPCTRLKISERGDYLAIGASDGAVVVVDVDTMKQVREKERVTEIQKARERKSHRERRKVTEREK